MRIHEYFQEVYHSIYRYCEAESALSELEKPLARN